MSHNFLWLIMIQFIGNCAIACPIGFGKKKFDQKKIPEKKFEKNLELESDWIRPSPLFFNILFFLPGTVQYMGRKFFLWPGNFSGVTPTKFLCPRFYFRVVKFFLTPGVFYGSLSDLQYCEYLSILQNKKSFNPHSHVKRENKKNSLGCSRQKKFFFR